MFILRIKELRLKKQWNQKKLAQKSGLSQTEISYLELNKRSPTLNTLEKISKALGTPIQDLILYKDENGFIYKFTKI